MKVFFLATITIIAFISGVKCKSLNLTIGQVVEDLLESIENDEKESPNKQDKIVGGQIIDISEVPYQVALQYNGEFFCGGSIISEDYILTAAHCTVDFAGDPTGLSVRVGSSYRDQDGTEVDVAEIHDHPKYKAKNMDNDFAILKLLTPLEFVVGQIEAIGLPTAKDIIEDGSFVYVSGYGDSLQPPGPEDSLLKGVQVPIVNQKVCKKSYKTLTKNMLCAGLAIGLKDSCQGDSGGPLRRKSDKLLVGVVSFGNGCAVPNFYGVYARVSMARAWITEITGL